MNTVDVETPTHGSPGWLSIAKLMVLVLPAVATGWALQETHLLADLGEEHLLMLASLLGGCVLSQSLAWLLWRRSMGGRALALGGAIFWLAQLSYYVGPGEVLVSVLLAAGSLAVGSLFLRDSSHGLDDRFLVGAAVMVSLAAWLLPIPVHGPRAYLIVFAILVLACRKRLGNDVVRLGSGVRKLGSRHPILLALLVAITGFASMGLWLPSLNYDDNSAHLTIQSQFLRDGYYRFDIGSQVWAMAPWFNNVWHAMGAMLLGDESRAAVNLLWLLLGVSGAYRLARVLGGSQRSGLLSALVYASHPLTAYFGTSMQVDGPTAAVMLHLLSVLCDRDLAKRSALVPGAMIGMLLALKMTNVVYLLLPCLYVTWVAFRQQEWSWWVRVVLVAVVTGGASYVYALALTGNPTFPMFNTLFQSPYYPLEGFSDPRWHVGIRPSLLWDITFETSQYMEAYPGAVGMSLLALLGGTLLAAFSRGRSLVLTLAVLLPAAILFSEVQYIRYVFPTLAVLGVVAVTALDRFLVHWPRILVLVLTALSLVNICLISSTSWIMQGGAWTGLFNEGKEYAAVLERSITPQHALLDRMVNRYPGACVLNADEGRPYTARLAGRSASIAWYDPQLHKAAVWSDQDKQGHRWVQIIRALGVSHVVVPKERDDPLLKALQGLDAQLEDKEQDLQLFRVPGAFGDNGVCEPRFFQSRDNAHRIFHESDTHGRP